jgi:hypothetical protein
MLYSEIIALCTDKWESFERLKVIPGGKNSGH